MATELPLADELAVVFARMSGLLFSTETIHTALELITALATEAVPRTEGAGVTMREAHGGRGTTAVTDALVSRVDDLQYELDEGPCLTAWHTRTLVRVDDLTREDRWPRWTPAAAATGLRAALSAPLVAGNEGLGAIKVYSTVPGAYGHREECLLMMFASQAAVLLANVRSHEDARRVSDELRESMRVRDVINTAKGVLMEREGVDGRTAFLLLAEMARQQDKPLREVAQGLAGTTVRRRR